MNKIIVKYFVDTRRNYSRNVWEYIKFALTKFSVAEARLVAELEKSKPEIQRLKESLSGGPPTVRKNLSLVSLVPKWSGLDSGVPIEQFVTSIEGAA